MSNNPGNDDSSSSYCRSSFSSLPLVSREDDDNSKPLPTSDPTPTVEGVQGTPMPDQEGESRGGRAIVLFTDGGAIVEASGVGAGVAAAIGGRDKGKVQAAPPSGDQKMTGRKKVGRGHPGASSSGEGVEKKPRKKSTRSNPTRCRVCDRVFKSCHAVYGHMNAHSGRNRASNVLCLPAPVPSERNGGNGALVLYVAQEVQFGPALPRPDGLIIDLNEPAPQEEEEDGGDGGENKEGDNAAAAK